MAPRSPQKLPYSEEAWKEEANSHKVPSIHDFEVTRSASKITFPQYIALKTIWKGHNINTLTENDEWPRRFGSTRAEILKKATEMKQDDKTWYNYLKALETPQNQQQGSQFKRNLGCFAMALQNQRETKALIETKLETQKVVVSPSPIAFRTRSKGKAVEPIPISFLPSSRGARTPSDHSSSPERQGRSQDRGKGSEFRSPSDASEAKSQASVLSTVDFEMSKEDRDSTVDEQVVNTAAITFLQSLFIYDDHQKAVWSAQRKGFCLGAGKGKTAFKAITDGHFRLIDEQRSAAILEVKARKRLEHSDFSIEMQETAQMALWIYEEPSSYWTSRQHPSTCHRVLISQDHTEIYVTIAEYDKSYVGYLREKVPFKDAGFLKMHRFGRFSIDTKDHMEKLGGILKVLLPYAAWFEPPSPSPSPPRRPAIGEGPGGSPTRERDPSRHTPQLFGPPVSQIEKGIRDISINQGPSRGMPSSDPQRRQASRGRESTNKPDGQNRRGR